MATAAGPAQSIDDVVAQMTAIQASLPPADGVACFNRLYLAVTEAVRSGVQGQQFDDPAFMARLDVVFANLFFQAYSDWTATGKCDPAWRPLFAHRSESSRPIRFALAGMNAHINHDLPLAIVATSTEFGLDPKHKTPQHRDFERVNAILRVVEVEIKKSFESRLSADIDRVAGPEDDRAEMWVIADARAAAWDHGHTLWHLRDHRELREAYLATLSRLVDMAGRGLLV